MCGHAWKARNGCPVVHRLTWLKSRLRILGLHRRGPMVHYSPVSQVQEAIEVCPATINNYNCNHTLATRTIPHYTTIQAELQGCSSNIGYRQMWVVLKQKHGLVVKRYERYCAIIPEETLEKLFLILHANTFTYRSTVQMLLYPEGARRRRGHQLRRRIYQNKVSFNIHVIMLLKMELALHLTFPL